MSGRYFVYSDESGFETFETAEERDEYAALCIEGYLNDAAWSDAVTSVVCGEITHRAAEVNRIDRPDDLDEEGCDEEGRYWPENMDAFCDYEMCPIE